jgi:hypothetical protein
VPRELPRVDRIVTLRAEQDDLVAGIDREVAAIDQQLVHRDVARDAATPPTDQHVGAT